MIALDVNTGRVFVHEILWTTTLVVSDPALVKEVLVAKAEHYVKAPIIRNLVWSVLGNGLVFADGDLWKSQRKIHDPAFQKTFLKVAFMNPINSCKSRGLASHRREIGHVWNQDYVCPRPHF